MPIIQAKNLKKFYPSPDTPNKQFAAVNDIDLTKTAKVVVENDGEQQIITIYPGKDNSVVFDAKGIAEESYEKVKLLLEKELKVSVVSFPMKLEKLTEIHDMILNVPGPKHLGQIGAVQVEEAKILTAIKDGVLLSLYPKLEKCLPILGIEEYNKPPRKSAKKKPAKTTTKTPRARKGKSNPDEVVI